MHAATPTNVLGSPRFEPLRVLGEGGSGIVYEVRIHSGLESSARPTVALKVLRAELAPSERERRRFLEEAERMQRLDAPGLVKLLEAGLLPDGRPYLAMPLLEGETLAARLRRGPMAAAEAVRHFEVLARAVSALHAAGMVHRDVKPENVLLVDNGPVLLDFGIARDIDDDTTTTTAEGRVRGTPAYMAPERFFGAPASVRSDVYELAVLLYTMLVGKLPWGSEKNVTERLNPASPRDAGADVSSALATVILRALSTRPEMRPASAHELAREVASAAADASAQDRVTEAQPVIGRSEAPPPALVPARSATRRLAIAAAVVIAAAAAAFGAKALRTPTPSPSVITVTPIAAAPTACAIPAAATPTPPAPEPPAAAATPTAAAHPPAAATPGPVRSTPPSSAPSAAPSANDPSRYFQDRK